jgi:heptosyltransferase-3
MKFHMKPDVSISPKNILLIQLGDIGDVVLTTPTIRAVKETYPNARVSILVFKPFGCLLAADPYLHEVIETTKTRGTLIKLLRESISFARKLRQKRYDLAIELRMGDRGAILSFITGAATRVAYSGAQISFWRNILFTKNLREMKVAPLPVHPGADQTLRVVRELGIDTADSTPKLYIAPDDLLRAYTLLAKTGIVRRTSMLTVNPFSRWKYKEWDNAKWGEVIDRIWEIHRIPSVLIGSTEEAAGCQDIVAGREGRVINLAGKTTLGELAALISLSSLHLGVDSAAPHIAAAVGTPTVTIHGPSDWRAWRIVDDRHRVISPTMDCLPCNMTGCDGCGKSQCLDELTAEPVICAALGLLGESLSAHR